jgi:hypothetical protein
MTPLTQVCSLHSLRFDTGTRYRYFGIRYEVPVTIPVPVFCRHCTGTGTVFKQILRQAKEWITFSSTRDLNWV